MLDINYINSTFKEGDKVELIAQDIIKQGTFHHVNIENNEIWIKQYKKKKACYVMNLNDEFTINKIDKFTIKKVETNYKIFG